jgi:Lon protease-like protein
MTNFIPIFPLGIVVFPGEKLNLHIFEPRYKQLINECYENKKPFGIPTVLDNRLNEMGTLVQVKEIVKVYDDGKIDIKTEGLKIFRILEFIRQVPDKLYSAAIVNYPENDERGSRSLMLKLLTKIRELHKALDVQKDFKKPDDDLCTYDIAHHAGMSIHEEYEFIGLMTELHRQEYLKRHLAKVLSVANEIEALKKKIQLNGHFKDLKSFDV